MSLAASKNLLLDTPTKGWNATTAAPFVESGPTKLKSVMCTALLTWNKSLSEFNGLT